MTSLKTLSAALKSRLMAKNAKFTWHAPTGQHSRVTTPDPHSRIAIPLVISARLCKMASATAVAIAVLAGSLGPSTVSAQSHGPATLTGHVDVCHQSILMVDHVDLFKMEHAMAVAAMDRVTGHGQSQAHSRSPGPMILTGIADAYLLTRYHKMTTALVFPLHSMEGHTSRRPGSLTKSNSSPQTCSEAPWSTMWI